MNGRFARISAYLTEPDAARWQRRLFVVGALLGWVMLFITPPFFGNDEEDYVFRAWQLSQGQLIADHRPGFSGGDIPSNWYQPWVSFSDPASLDFYCRIPVDSVLHYTNRPLNSEQTQPIDFRNTALYSPVGFLPHLPAMWVGQALNLPAFTVIYLARGLQYIVWLLLMVLAIRRLPGSGFFWLLLIFLPMSLYQATTVTVDGLNNSLAFLFIASVLRWRALHLTLTRKRLAFALVCLLAFVLIKQMYVLLGLFLLILTAAQWGGLWRKVVWVSALMLVAMLIGGLWSKLAFQVYEPMHADIFGIQNPPEQLRFLLSHPLVYAQALFAGVAEWGAVLWDSWLGVLGKTSVELPPSVYLLLTTAVCALLVIDRPMLIRTPLYVRVVSFGTFALGVAAMFTIIVMTNHSPGELRFDGVVGRYLIPFAPLLWVALQPNLPRLVRPNWLALFTGGVMVFALLQSLRALVLRFYGVDFIHLLF
ncbi:MAG: DUF2142 domain-containing protein [Bacteroidota bacterium]